LLSQEKDLHAMPADNTVSPIELVPAVTAARELHVTRRTVGRWMLDPAVGFPPSVEINTRLYFRRDELESWKVSRAAGIPAKAAG
jgi:hypothetical protein